jgi:hypothetical protein
MMSVEQLNTVLLISQLTSVYLSFWILIRMWQVWHYLWTDVIQIINSILFEQKIFAFLKFIDIECKLPSDSIMPVNPTGPENRIISHSIEFCAWKNWKIPNSVKNLSGYHRIMVSGFRTRLYWKQLNLILSSQLIESRYIHPTLVFATNYKMLNSEQMIIEKNLSVPFVILATLDKLWIAMILS